MARMVAAALAALLLMGCAHQAAAASGRSLLTVPVSCPPPKCPSGYVAMSVGSGFDGTACGYECYTQYKANCQDPELAAPRTCGGITLKPCPAIACAYSASYAISGPTGCATASSRIDAIAISQAKYDVMIGTVGPVIKSYCANPDSMPLAAAVNQTVNAVSSAIAQTITHLSTYVCSCCTGNSGAYTVVKADVQAMALAQAQSLQTLLAKVRDCYGGSTSSPNNNLLAGANAYAMAIGQDIQLAIDSVYKEALSIKGFACNAGYFAPRIQTAVARVLACTFANVYAGAIDAQTPGVAEACSDTLVVTGYGTPLTCPLDIACKCTPEAYYYDNLGFDTGAFDGGSNGGSPMWDVVSDQIVDPSVITSDTVSTATNTIRLAPQAGRYFAKIPAGPPGSPSSIATSITVPACAAEIAASYIFKCNDFAPYNDKGTITITVVDTIDSSNVIPVQEIDVDCSTTGDYGITGSPANGYWTTSLISVPHGQYSVTIAASSVNALDNASSYSSTVYVDSITFSA